MSTEQIKQSLMDVNNGKFKLIESDLYLDCEEDMFHIKTHETEQSIYIVRGQNTSNPQLFSYQKWWSSSLSISELKIILSFLESLAENKFYK